VTHWPARASCDHPGVELADFIARHAPPPGRVLEIGCGKGDLARQLDAAGYDVTAIDPAAPDGPIFRKIKLEELEEDGEPFDLVVASRSLHHVTNIDGALAKVTRLLRARGVLVLEEFAWDRLDDATAEWFLDQRRILAAGRGSVPESLAECCREWADEHVGLHGYEAMRTALDARFEELRFEWRPYLHRLLDGGEGPRREQELIDTDAIRAMGFRYVGRPRAEE
jgi:SAM-dependent methyltransferase